MFHVGEIKGQEREGQNPHSRTIDKQQQTDCNVSGLSGRRMNNTHRLESCENWECLCCYNMCLNVKLSLDFTHFSDMSQLE